MDSKEILLEVYFNSGKIDYYIVDDNFYQTQIVPWFKDIAKVRGDAIVLLDANGFKTMISRYNICMMKSIEDEQEIAYYKKLASRYEKQKNVKL